jgi:hypothetical protein
MRRIPAVTLCHENILTELFLKNKKHNEITNDFLIQKTIAQNSQELEIKLEIEINQIR